MPDVDTKTDVADAILGRIVSRTSVYESASGWGLAHVAGRHLLADPEASRAQNALVDLMAFVGSFTSTRLLDMCPELDEESVFTWKSREASWAKHGGVALRDAGTLWDQLEGFVEVRNALQHGQGRLTDRQLSRKRRKAVLQAVLASGVFLDGDRVVVVNADIAACGRVCGGFVRWLDAAAGI